jgi:hypothetical protein
MSSSVLERLKLINKNTLAIAAGIMTGTIATFGAGIYFAPYLTVNNLKNATINRNAEALAAEIDFPALRANVKEGVKAQVLKQVAADSSATDRANPELVAQIVSPIVDKILTPEGLEQLLLDKIPDLKIDLTNLERDMARSNVEMGYVSFDRFVVHIRDKTDRQKDVSLTLNRDGLGWKLTDIDISQV